MSLVTNLLLPLLVPSHTFFVLLSESRWDRPHGALIAMYHTLDHARDINTAIYKKERLFIHILCHDHKTQQSAHAPGSLFFFCVCVHGS